MEMPNVVHPKVFKIDGRYFQVVAFCKMSDAQALKALAYSLQGGKYKKLKSRGSLGNPIRVVTIHDESSLALL